MNKKEIKKYIMYSKNSDGENYSINHYESDFGVWVRLEDCESIIEKLEKKIEELEEKSSLLTKCLKFTEKELFEVTDQLHKIKKT